MPKNTDNIVLRRDGDIGILELNNPPENYLTQPEFVSLSAMQKFVDTGIKGLVISGVGRHFSAGADPESIIEQATQSNELKHELIKGKQLLKSIENLKIPVIAAITGVCFGGGLEIALSCHIRIASHKSLFAFPEVNQEIIPGLDGISKTERIVGKLNSLKLILSGDTINANTALDLKLVDEISDQKNVLNVAVNLLNEITTARSLKIINSVMSSINNSRNLPYEDALIKDAEMFCLLALDEANRRKKL